MGTSYGSARRGASFAAVIANLILVLCLPGAALAATTSFSGLTPPKGSVLLALRPLIAVTVTDTYGVRGSDSYTVRIDGVKSRASVTYTKRYRRLRISARPTRDLQPGLHTVMVTVKNLKKKSASRSWTFSVAAPAPPVLTGMPESIPTAACTACHPGYPAVHPMAACAGCHGAGAPLGGSAYTPSQTSPHTLSCALRVPCHGRGSIFPHVLGPDCGSCHNGALVTPGPSHGAYSAADHVVTDTLCTRAGCHLPSLADEHYRHTVAGEKLACLTCHGSQDPRVRAAIAAESTACVECHVFDDATHPGAIKHLLPALACTVGGCHDEASVVTVHRGACGDCHRVGKSASVVCTDCHGPHDHVAAPAPETIRIGGVDFGQHRCIECHAQLDLVPLHTGGPSACVKCHPALRATLAPWNYGCVQGACHVAASTTAMHGSIDAAHALVVAPGCVATDCHTGGKNVAAIHRVQGCVVCHGAGTTSPLACATGGCHGAEDAHPASLPHPKMAPGHTQSLPATCQGAKCHVADLAVLHAPGRGCATCHGVGKTAKKECATVGCHPFAVGSTVLHPKYDAGHVTQATGCSAPGCHVANVIALHTTGVTRPGCLACHAAGKPALTLGCGTLGCHPATPSSHRGHPADPASEGIVISGIDYGVHACSECHAVLDLIPLHAEKCAACHTAAPTGATFAKGCVQTACHAGGALAKHGEIRTAHVLLTAPGCTLEDCHAGGSDVVAIHDTQGCATCHRPGVPTPLLCATTGCHSDTDAHPVSDAHPKMTAGHTADLPIGCAMPGCHTIDLVRLHSAKQGCATCHATGKTATKECATVGCHPYAVPSATLHPKYADGHRTGGAGCTVATCHAVDVIVIHTSGRKRPGCPACHAANRSTLTLECGIEGCHPVKPVAHSSHPVLPASESVTIGGADLGSHACSECHDPLDLIALHKGACAACHPGAATGAVRTGGCVQGSCHAAGPLAKHAAIEQAHTLGSAPGCVAADCHAGGLNVAAIHRTQRCSVCHRAGTKAVLECATIGCHSASDTHPAAGPHPKMQPGHTTGLPTCARGGCHVSDLATLHVPKTGCATCHGADLSPSKTCVQVGCHSTSGGTLLHPRFLSAHTLEAVPSCVGTNCHAGGTGVTGIHISKGCASCHDSGKPALTLACETTACHSGTDSHPAADPHPKMGPGHTTGLAASCVNDACHVSDVVVLHALKKGCSTCHGTGKTATADCVASGCHPANGSPRHETHPSTVTTATFRINDLSYGAYACSLCHESTDLIAIHGKRASCVKCHPGRVNGIRPWNGGCDQAGCHDPASTRPMHADVDAKHQTAVQPGCTVDGCHFGNSRVGGRDVVLVHFAKGKCTTCHGGGKTPTIDCIRCHQQAATGDHQVDHVSCNDCHQPYVWDYATSTANKGALLSTGVHWPVFDAAWTVLIGRATIRQGYPFGDYTQLVFPGPIGGPGPYTSAPYLGYTGTYTCSTCHTGAGKTWVHPGSTYFTCGSGGDCHQHHGNWDPAENSETYVHNTPPASWRQTMKW